MKAVRSKADNVLMCSAYVECKIQHYERVDNMADEIEGKVLTEELAPDPFDDLHAPVPDYIDATISVNEKAEARALARREKVLAEGQKKFQEELGTVRDHAA